MFTAWHVYPDRQQALREGRRWLLLRGIFRPWLLAEFLAPDDVALVMASQAAFARAFAAGSHEVEGVPDRVLDALVENVTVAGIAGQPGAGAGETAAPEGGGPRRRGPAALRGPRGVDPADRASGCCPRCRSGVRPRPGFPSRESSRTPSSPAGTPGRGCRRSYSTGRWRSDLVVPRCFFASSRSLARALRRLRRHPVARDVAGGSDQFVQAGEGVVAVLLLVPEALGLDHQDAVPAQPPVVQREEPGLDRAPAARRPGRRSAGGWRSPPCSRSARRRPGTGRPSIRPLPAGP